MPDLSVILNMLDRDDALELSQRPPNRDERLWPTAEDQELLEVDYQRLFPNRRPVDRGFQDFEVYGDEWFIDDEAVEGIVGGVGTVPDESEPPEWDIWAWYQPIHYFGPDWGVFIKEDALRLLARRIGHRLPAGVRGGRDPELAKALVRAAFAALFLHEQYHHKTESAALRMHVIERRPVYPDYHAGVYRRFAGTDDQIEEGLANADSWRRLDEPAYKRWTGSTVLRTTRDYLFDAFHVAPPGYRNATGLLDDDSFQVEQHELFAQLQDGATHHRPYVSEFGISTHLNHGLFRVTQRIWTVVPSGGRSILPTHPAIAPLAAAKLERYLKKQGWSEVPGAGKGGHRKFRNAEGQMIILRSEKEVSLPVLKSTAGTLGVTVHGLKELAG